MNVGQYLLLAAAVGANNFAATLALGALGQAHRWPRVVTVFAAVEFSVPLVGIAIGQAMAGWLGWVARWLGPALLIGLGLWVLWTAREAPEQAESAAGQATSWPGLLVFSLGLAMDNLLVGYSLGLVDAAPVPTASVMAVGAVVSALLGLSIGHFTRQQGAVWPTRLAGVMLVVIGLATAWGVV